MCARKSAEADIAAAVQSLGPGPLTEAGLMRHIRPLFSRALRHAAGRIYLANHSLGRPLDRMADDVAAGIGYWYAHMDKSWDQWLVAIQTFRAQVARLLQAPRADCVVPRANAGQALRAVLNCYDKKLRVVTTRGEFNSIDFILKVYARRGRITLTTVAPDREGYYHSRDILQAMGKQTDLLIVSMTLFITGQVLTDLGELIAAAQARGARVLVDVYHAAGVLPVNVQTLGMDFALGGCYKYLRGGPGASWLYVHPRHLDGSLIPLDTGWFAQETPFAFGRPPQPHFAPGGNAFLESTPAILPFYQAKAGLEFTLALGVERLRNYSLQQLCLLRSELGKQGLEAFGTAADCGAFIAVPHPQATRLSQLLEKQGVQTDAREGYLRLGPDLLNTEEELRMAVGRLEALSG